MIKKKKDINEIEKEEINTEEDTNGKKIKTNQNPPKEKEGKKNRKNQKRKRI